VAAIPLMSPCATRWELIGEDRSVSPDLKQIDGD